MGSKTRLPPISAALVIEVTGLEIARDANGMVWCRDDGIGALRTRLGAVPPQRPRLKHGPELSVEKARDGARVVLAETCKRCPCIECTLKTW